MAQQLTLLMVALKKTEIASLIAEGGPEAVSALDAAIVALRKADQEDVGVRGTPMETAMLDLLDGIIVQNVRKARRVAVVAGRKLGNAAIAKDFKLDKLYGNRAAAPPKVTCVGAWGKSTRQSRKNVSNMHLPPEPTVPPARSIARLQWVDDSVRLIRRCRPMASCWRAATHL